MAGACLASVAAHSAGVDPLEAEIVSVDAQRFANLFKASDGKPTAEQLQRGYLDGAGRGVAVFTPYRIKNAGNLAAAIARDGERYRYAIEHCLPLLPSLRAELRATYLAYAGLLPERPLPEIHVVFGAGNSGGTASPEAQVLGLEVMCGPGTTAEDFRIAMRGIFAHETVHTWQDFESTPARQRDPLLLMALVEGVPDYLASLVTGAVPLAQRHTWALERERGLWQEFQGDARAVQAGTNDTGEQSPAADRLVKRWFQNYGRAPEGWPYEAGYWIGMRIAERYVTQASDKHAAIRELLLLSDPAAILKASAYAP